MGADCNLDGRRDPESLVRREHDKSVIFDINEKLSQTTDLL